MKFWSNSRARFGQVAFGTLFVGGCFFVFWGRRSGVTLESYKNSVACHPPPPIASKFGTPRPGTEVSRALRAPGRPFGLFSDSLGVPGFPTLASSVATSPAAPTPTQHVRCANTQPFLSWGNFQAILGNLLGPFSGIFRQFLPVLGNFGQFRVILSDVGGGGGQNPRKKPVLINRNTVEDCTPTTRK